MSHIEMIEARSNDAVIPEAGEAAIHVVRSASFPDMLRKYRILVDGQERARVGPDESVVLRVRPGQHRVVARIDWCGSPPLECDVRAGEMLHLECGSNLRGLRFVLVLVYWLFLPNRYLTLVRA